MLEQEKQFKTISIETFKNIATRKKEYLGRLQLRNAYDLIFNLPFRYDDRSYIQPLCDLLDDEVVLTKPYNILFTVENNEPIATDKATTFIAQDVSGTVFEITFFSAKDFAIKVLLENDWFLAFGYLKYNSYSDKLTLFHPQLKILDKAQFELPCQLYPIYHLTSGISQDFMHTLEAQALELLQAHPLEELIPSELNPFRLTLTEALLITHNPPCTALHESLHIEDLPSFRRICFEELVAYKLAISKISENQHDATPFFIPYDPKIHQDFLATLPFQPTKAQSRAFYEIMCDCTKSQAMSRIVNGDVGSGKTLVAALCMLQCAKAELQTVMLAPTEILAQQHYQKLSKMFEPLGIKVGLLTGSLKRKEKNELLEHCASGEIKIIVGTHAVFQAAVEYNCLALVIIDEQHRFGVSERERLLNKAPDGFAAHELLMTATPIPRSLRLAMFQATAVSVLNEMPKGRMPIQTSLLEAGIIDQLYSRLRYQCNHGEQAYWICPFVDDAEYEPSNTGAPTTTRRPMSVTHRVSELQRIMPEVRIGVLHGKMSDTEKSQVMSDFLACRYQLLVATVIVEVGVDVPNASIIVIEDPNHFGLSQLHQLRGRVGRGSKQSYCILLYHKDVTNETTPSKRKKKKTTSTNAHVTAGVEINQTNSNLSDNDAGKIYGVDINDLPELEDEILSAQKLSQEDTLDWNADPQLQQALKEIQESKDPIYLKRLKILRCTNNGFAIASQDLILRGPGEFFGNNQTGKENFKYASLVRDYLMLPHVNKVATAIYESDPELTNALIERWYPEFMNHLVDAEYLSSDSENDQQNVTMLADLREHSDSDKYELDADDETDVVSDDEANDDADEADVDSDDDSDEADADADVDADESDKSDESNGDLDAADDEESAIDYINATVPSFDELCKLQELNTDANSTHGETIEPANIVLDPAMTSFDTLIDSVDEAKSQQALADTLELIEGQADAAVTSEAAVANNFDNNDSESHSKTNAEHNADEHDDHDSKQEAAPYLENPTKAHLETYFDQDGNPIFEQDPKIYEQYSDAHSNLEGALYPQSEAAGHFEQNVEYAVESNLQSPKMDPMSYIEDSNNAAQIPEQETECMSGSYFEAEAKTIFRSENEPEVESKVELETESEIEPETEPEVKSDTEPKIESEVESEVESVNGTESAKSLSKPATMTEIEQQSMTQTKLETLAEVENKPIFETRAMSLQNAETGFNQDTTSVTDSESSPELAANTFDPNEGKVPDNADSSLESEVTRHGEKEVTAASQTTMKAKVKAKSKSKAKASTKSKGKSEGKNETNNEVKTKGTTKAKSKASSEAKTEEKAPTLNDASQENTSAESALASISAESNEANALSSEKKESDPKTPYLDYPIPF